MAVQFTDTSTGSPTSRSWDFGDGTTSTEASPAHTYVGSGTYTARLTVGSAGGSSTTTTTIIVSPSGSRFMPVASTRVLSGKALRKGTFTTVTLKPPPGTTGVALNVTATKVTRKTTIAVCASDDSSTDCLTQAAVRAYKGGRSAGFTITKLGPDDAIKLYNARGTATVNLDVRGWYVGSSKQTYFTSAGSSRRVLTAQRVGPGKAFTFKIPATYRPTGTLAVGLNVTASGASRSTSVGVCGGSTRKGTCAKAPSLFPDGSRTVTNHVVTPVGPGGTVKLVNDRGSVFLTVDVQGAYATTDTAALFRSNPLRRVTTGQPMTAKGVFTVTMRALPPGTSSVALRVTVSAPSADGYLSACRGGTPKKVCKVTSVLAVQRGRTTTNIVVVPVGPGGTVKFYNAAGKNKLTIDSIGSFGRN